MFYTNNCSQRDCVTRWTYVLKDFKTIQVLSEWAPMFLKFLWCLAVKTITNSEDPYWNKFNGRAPSFGYSNNCSGSRLWWWNCSESRQWHLHFRGFFLYGILNEEKSTNSRKRKANRNLDAALGTIFRISKCFHRRKRQLFKIYFMSYHVWVPGGDVYVHLVDLDAHDQAQVLLRVLHPLAATDNIYQAVHH